MNYKKEWEDALKQVETWKKAGIKVVFTNGCFDLLHPGHIDYLHKARQLGDVLIVGLNDDDSISRLKGPERPINPLEDRSIMLSALKSVDLVVPFSEDTPLGLISKLLPDLLVKGGDYQPDDIVGAKEVRANGGHVTVITFVDGHSTTALIERIKSIA
ncbi:D-beta-D-heptose 7-phosphate kinase / D-beta-D-heptose 1-phosphate adenosyltransferase [Mariprofundus micogutta]|uniref:D-glycero-beta-D-manno-heptose 1-phosphate adenylyltransferase n=1 Tax=Mariprofundus micogutta TaxID=1921010 RepID=A0A1L8CR66_9PROT|nr:D-glycero-beta-D-manno-heptose 1-phosphate adenylyltransferase [Mariprofundus micogutta]GAV21421.1 D-beta-D-heptose 7-phosphate kinase / D-beta-D-heptose 1-phosphate adenosyltransferase [Mariprofundus micogutta]